MQDAGHHRETHQEIVERDRDVWYVLRDAADRERPDADRAQNPGVQFQDISDIPLITGIRQCRV